MCALKPPAPFDRGAGTRAYLLDCGADAVRLSPDDDGIAVTAAQLRDVITRLIEAGHRQDGDPAIL